jgi:hypothetical protein
MVEKSKIWEENMQQFINLFVASLLFNSNKFYPQKRDYFRNTMDHRTSGSSCFLLANCILSWIFCVIHLLCYLCLVFLVIQQPVGTTSEPGQILGNLCLISSLCNGSVNVH